MQSERSQLSIRLAFIVHGFEYGGLERCVANLVNHLDPGKFQPHIIALTRLGNAREWVQSENVRFAQLDKSSGNDFGVYRRLADYLKSEEIQLVHSHNWGTLLETAVACRWTTTPFIHAEHGLDFGRIASGIKGAIRQQLKRWGMKQSACLVPIAECVKAKLLEVVGPNGTKIELIRNGVALPEGLDDAEFCKQTRDQLGIPPNATVLGSVGRLGNVKGFDLAIEAMKRIATHRKDCHMLLVGDGPEREKLETLVAQSGLTGRVHLVGSQRKVGAWLRVMDIFFNSSRSEAMNLGILEAMAAGVPIVAMDVGDNRVLVEKQQRVGVVVPAGDVEQFSEKLIELASDPQECFEMGQEGRLAFERHYTLRTMADQYSDLYCATLGTGR